MNRSIIIVVTLIIILILPGCGKNTAAIDASGILEAVEVNVAAKVPGQLLRLNVSEGTSVKKGDTLAILDHESLQLQWKQAQAGVDLAQSQYELLKNGARKEDLRSAEEAVRQTESAFRSAESDFKRIKELFASHSVTQKQYEDAESRYTITQAQFNTAQQNQQKLQRFARTEDLAAAKARVDQAIAQRDLIRKQISDTYILAPVDGIVTAQPMEEGELVGTGAVIVRLSRLSSMELMIYVNETELGKVKLNAGADVTIDTYPDKKFPAKVVYISPVAEFTPRNVQTKDERTKLVFGVKLEVENPDGELKSGMPADAVIQ